LSIIKPFFFSLSPTEITFNVIGTWIRIDEQSVRQNSGGAATARAWLKVIS